MPGRPGGRAFAGVVLIWTAPGERAAAGGAQARGQAEARSRTRSSSKLAAALSQPDQQATTVFAGAVEPLRWSNPAVAQSVHLEVTELEEQLGIASPDVCADMRAWVASGYTTLSASTKELFSSREAIARRTLGVRPILPLLAPYENAGDRALIDKTKQVEHRELGPLKTVLHAFAALQRTLGVTPPHAKTLATILGPAKGSVVIARGRTASGGRYSVRVEPRRRHLAPGERGCVSVTITDGRGRFGGSSGSCYSPSRVYRGGSVNCNEGLLTIEAQTDPRARTVSLLLSDGRRIASRVVRVPTRLGGPVGLYYQVVRGPAPVPVSLTSSAPTARPCAS